MSRDFDEVLRELDEDTDRAIGKVANLLAAEIKIELSNPGRGRTYPRGKGRTHTASRPFDPPAPDTGELRRSVYAEKVADRQWRVGARADYAEPLEFGTATMAPRPFMTAALRRAQQALETTFFVALSSYNEDLRYGRR